MLFVMLEYVKYVNKYQQHITQQLYIGYILVITNCKIQDLQRNIVINKLPLKLLIVSRLVGYTKSKPN